MRILITGGHGFIGKHCYEYFKNKYTVFAPTHSELDLYNIDLLCNYINDNKINSIIHAATIISRRFSPLKPVEAYHSLLMFENIFYAAKRCQYFINFGSGAELGNYPKENIDNVKEDYINNYITQECGGFIKRVITKRLLAIESPQCFNLRIAGCFGEHEKEDRFIKANMLRIKNENHIEIHQNRYMDFIYVKDLTKIIDFIFNNSISYRDINCVYEEKYTLLDIAKKIKEITNTVLPIKVQHETLGTSYTLNGQRLAKLNIPMMGLTQGIRELYDKYYHTNI